MKYGLSIAFAVLWLALGQAPANAQSFEKGLAAARAGDFTAAIAEWQPLASEGNAEARFNLGAIYEAGLGVPADAAEAAGWYALAAGQGHARAQYNLGMMYADGRGVPRDDARAATWLRKAAEQDHAKAQYNLAVLYQTGRGLPRDVDRAKIWFGRAAANGVAPPGDGNGGDASTTKPEVSNNESAPPSESAGPGPERVDASAAVEPPLQTASDDNLEPADEPFAAKAIGLNLHEFELDVPAEPPAARAGPVGPDADPSAAPDESPAVASLPAGQLRIAVKFPEGARYRIEISETRQRARDGDLVMAQSSQMAVDMVVKPGFGDGALIEWTFGPATVKTAGDPRAGRLASELGKLIDGQIVAYRTDGSGAVTGLSNPGQLASFYERSVERILRGIEAQTADPQLADIVRANVQPLLSDEYATARALDLPRLLHFFSGLELAPGKTYGRDSVMRLPPSADALPSTLAYEMMWFDRTAGVAWLRWRQSVDPERAARAMKAYIAALAAQSGRAAPAQLDLGAINVSDSADYEIDLATGFPRQVIYTRTVELFGFTQTEKRRVRVIH